MASTTSEPRQPVPNALRLRRALHPANLRRIVFICALLNSVLYACFLPLWEGFDEPFHYAYVQDLSAGRVPVFGKAKLSAEIDSSFADVPLSRFLSGSAGADSFEQWFNLPDRGLRRERLNDLAWNLRNQASDFDNYEAQQAPLAYALLVPFDLAFSHIGLRWRIVLVRLVCSVVALLLLWIAVEPYSVAAMSCLFASQMLWATVAHVGNDYLAVPLTTLFLACLMRRNALLLSFVFAAGLLAKAYFLAFLPVFIAFLLVRKRYIYLLIPALIAGPCYVHNKLLYGSFSGTQQSVAGIGLAQAFAAAPHIPWFSSAMAFLHWSLWTGNWSFLSFSQLTLNIELALMTFGIALYFRRYRTIKRADWWALAAGVCFIAGLIYQTCVTYIHTHGASLFAEPWYWQGIVCFLWILIFRGFEQANGLGRILAIASVLVTAWVAAATYLAKLLPAYGGGFQRSTLSHIWSWWTSHPTRDLSTVALAPPVVVYVLLALFLVTLIAQTALIVAELGGADHRLSWSAKSTTA